MGEAEYLHDGLQVCSGAATILPTGLGGSCAWGRNTGRLGTRPGRSLPTHSRHNANHTLKKDACNRYGYAMCAKLSNGFLRPATGLTVTFADESATGEPYRA